MRLKHLTVIFLVLHLNSSASSVSETCKNCSTLLPRLHVFKRHVLSRRKRGIIFPKKSFLLLTQAFTKAVIDGRPPGVAYSIEFDMYSELPDSLEAWKPTLLLEKIGQDKKVEEEEAEVATPPPPTPMPPTMPMSIESGMDYDHDNVWPIDYEYPASFAHDHDPFMMDSPNWRNPFELSRRWENRPNYENEMKNFYKKHIWKKGKARPSPSASYFNDDVNHGWPFPEEIYDNIEQVPVWKYDRSYRERRDLFGQLETLGKIFNIDMRACIQRAMCEMSSSLRPFGEYLMEDIVRIILTIPKKVNYGDEYSFDFSQHAGENETDCALHFKESCPYRVIDFLTTTLRTGKLEEHLSNDDGRSAGIVRSRASLVP